MTDVSLDLMNYWPAKEVHNYFAEFVGADPWLPIIDMAGPGVIRGDALIPPSEVERSLMYQQLFRPIGDDTSRLLAYVSSKRDPRLIIAVHRAGGDRAFDSADMERLSVIRPHVERVLTLRSRLGSIGERDRGELALLDAMGKAVLLVDRNLRVAACSETARPYLDRRDGLCLHEGRLSFVGHGLDAGVRASVRSLIDRGAPRPTSFHIPRKEPARPLLLFILPAGPETASGALIHLDDLTRLPGDAARRALTELYGLSVAEVSVALALAQGEKIATIAERRGVTSETVRSQAKHIYAKTDVNSQGKLARLVGRLPS